MKICVLTSGGDCPGLNACLRAIFLHAKKTYNWEVVGSYDGLNGLVLDHFYNFKTLPRSYEGGSILGSVNKGNTGTLIKKAVAQFHKNKFDALINIGGDGSCRIMRQIYQKENVPLIMVPKTIDNDLGKTDWSIGHMTSLQIVVDAMDRLYTTAKTHKRIFVLEVMGRGAGHIALHAGVAGSADAILIPERTYDIEKLAKHLKAKNHALIVVAEGTLKLNGIPCTKILSKGSAYYCGIGDYIAQELKPHVSHDIRVNVLGHMQRGGTPVAFDRLLASALGVRAVDLIAEKKFGHIVGLRGQDVVSSPIQEAIQPYAAVLQTSFFLKTAQNLGIYVGNEKK